MALPGFDPAVGNSFGLEVDGAVIQQITEISGLRLGQDVIEFKATTPDGRYVIREAPGTPGGGEVTLTRGPGAGAGFGQSIADGRLGTTGGSGRNAAIIVFDHQGMPIRRYRLVGAWAKRLETSRSRPGETGMLTEKLVVAYESIEVE